MAIHIRRLIQFASSSNLVQLNANTVSIAFASQIHKRYQVNSTVVVNCFVKESTLSAFFFVRYCDITILYINYYYLQFLGSSVAII